LRKARRKRAVCERLALTIALGGPMATTSPPALPPSRPRSMIQALWYEPEPRASLAQIRAACQLTSTVTVAHASVGSWRGRRACRDSVERRQ